MVFPFPYATFPFPLAPFPFTFALFSLLPRFPSLFLFSFPLPPSFFSPSLPPILIFSLKPMKAHIFAYPLPTLDFLSQFQYLMAEFMQKFVQMNTSLLQWQF